jgi:predicted metal-binding protein
LNDTGAKNGPFGGSFEKALIETVDESGKSVFYEKYTAITGVSDFEWGPRYKGFCEACPEFGKRFSCPPHSPFFLEYVGEARKAIVICVRFPGEQFSHLSGKADYLTRFFKKAGKVLADVLLGYRSRGHMIAGSGPCLACERCGAETGLEACPNPGKQIYSLESLGVNVAGLCKKALDLDLEWGTDGRPAGHVCAVGAVFLP